jgi:nitrate reductase cytochrome c-type subunit
MIQQFHKNNKGVERVEQIYAKWNSGCRLEEIGKQYGITRERVRQLLNKFLLKKIENLANEGFKIDPSEFFNSEKKRHHQNSIKIHPKKIAVKREKRWSKYYDKCLNCGTNLIKHLSHGYCQKCYSKTSMFKEIQEKSRLKNIDKWKIKQKEYSKKYHRNPEVINRIKNRPIDINKLKILERDGYKCHDCGITQEESTTKYGKKLYIVHVNGNINSFENLTLRCIKCHGRVVTEKMRQKKLSKTY